MGLWNYPYITVNASTCKWYTFIAMTIFGDCATERYTFYKGIRYDHKDFL